MFSAIGQVLAAEAEEGQDTLREEAEDLRQVRVPLLYRLFRGRREVAVVRRARVVALRGRVRLVRQ